MKAVTERAGPPAVHALGLAAAGAALLCASFVVPLGLFDCPLRAATGIACPTCGCTRAFHWFVRGDLAAALRASPLGTLLALACLVHALWTLARLFGLPYALKLPQPTRLLRYSTGFAILLNWAYVALS
ncbi:MAG TPA: DUF2752 domain-containing protein [Myxococcales bacterium]|nr:DUF2752 domain-containing protein [Myxococcales bacterium]